jgi:hypothetical protein
MTKLGDMFHIPVTDRLNKRRPCVQKTIGRSGTLFCHFLLILVHGMRFDELSRVVQQGPARGHASHGGAVAAGWLPAGWLLGAGGTASQPGGLAEDAA